MEIIIRRRDIYVVAVVLSVFFSWVAYATYENFDARTTLRDMAEVHIDEWFDSEPEGTSRDDFEYLAIVDMERPYELFGPAFGVVHIYIRDRGDEECKTFKGIEYYYRMSDSGWDLEHSAGCAAKQHHIRAFQSYIDQGSGVHYTAIDEALGIDFDVARAEEYLNARQEGRNPFMASHSHDHDDHTGHDHAPHDGHSGHQLDAGHGHSGSHDHGAHPHRAESLGGVPSPIVASPESIDASVDSEERSYRPSRQLGVQRREAAGLTEPSEVTHEESATP